MRICLVVLEGMVRLRRAIYPNDAKHTEWVFIWSSEHSINDLCCSFYCARGIDWKEIALPRGTLRGWRSLRDGYTGFALGLPLVGNEILYRDQRER